MRSWVGGRGAGRRRRRVSAQSRCRGAGRRRRRANRGVAFVRTDISHFTHTHIVVVHRSFFSLSDLALVTLSRSSLALAINRSPPVLRDGYLPFHPSPHTLPVYPHRPRRNRPLPSPPVKIRLACAASLPYSATPPLSALVQTLTLRRLLISHQLSSHQFLFFT